MKNHVLEYLDDYLHDLLAPREARQLEEHCQQCRICATGLEEARKRQSALQSVPPAEASETLIQSTLAALARHADDETKRRRVWRRAAFGVGAALAASVLLLLGLGYHYRNLTPSPYDLTLLGQDRLLAGSHASLRVRLQDRVHNAPLAQAAVEIAIAKPDSEEFVSLVSFQTDDQGSGTPRFTLPDWPDGYYELRVIAQTPGGPEVLKEKIRLQRSWNLMLSTDKPVYQPNQTIHVRSLALRRPDLKPVAGQNAVFSITDPKGNIIFKKTGVSSKFGISSADCPLADELIEGAYTIACKIGDTESKRTVEVKRYVLPKFKIDVAGLEPFYRPGQRVKGSVQVHYFFGQPVVNADVVLHARSGSLAGLDREKLELKTDAVGNAAFDFILGDRWFGRPQDGGDARVFLDIAVRDTAGQQQSRTLSRIVTSQELKIDVIPEAGTLVRDMDNTIHVFVSYPDGRPVKNARLAISGIDEEITTSQLGVASFEYRPFAMVSRANPPGPVELVIRATDERGRTAQRDVVLEVGALGPDFLVRTDKATYSSGDTIHLTALGGGVEPVFIDLIKDSQTMLTETVEMGRAGTVAHASGSDEFTIPPDLFGTVELVAYRFGSDGVPVRKSRVLYIRPADQLTVHTTTDKKEYRPGELAQVLFRITDADGKPVVGALSLSAVDEAVYSVLDQAPGMEKVFYLLETKLLEPVYAIYPWAPDLTTSLPPVERDRFEQALFARTASAAIAPRNGVNQSHSLNQSSFPVKAEEIRQRRRSALDSLSRAWIVFGIILAASGLAGGLRLAHQLGVFTAIRESLTANEDRLERGMGILGWTLAGIVMIFIMLVAVSFVGQQASTTFSTIGMSMVDDGVRFGMPVREMAPVAKAAPQLGFKSEPPPMSLLPPLSAPPRVREWFPETLLWRPEVITDDQGRYTLPLDLADSITTWRLTASAVSADGRLGASENPVLVFQPFFVDLNLPVALTRNDEVAVPVVVHNHLDRPQSVTLKLAAAGWFDLLEDGDKAVELQPHEVKAVHYRLKVRKVGLHRLEVTALGSGVADAIKKEIDVVPDGRKVEQVASGSLDQPFSQKLDLPGNAIEGSPRLFVKLYPSTFSQLVEGLDAIFQMPYGCFEQTSSTTYPNILALDYLRRTKKSVPAVEAKARQYIHIGYQRLVSFEVSGGGFDWFGRPPANVRLTAYGLMEFRDMARVHDVDPNLIDRTQRWLLQQRRADGSWPAAEGLHMENNPARNQAGNMADYAMTAYVAWSVFAGQPANGEEIATKAYLLGRAPEQIADPYVLALTCNALLAMDPRGSAALPYLDRLEAIKQSSNDGKAAWWNMGDGRTAFYGSGQSGNVEATALAALAFLEAKRHPASTRAALTWIAQQKDGRGTWHSTQATILALKALLAGTGASLGEDAERRIEVVLGETKQTIVIARDQADVMRQIDLSDNLLADQELRVRETTQGGTMFQMVFRYHVPDDQPKGKDGPLAIEMTYDRSELAVNDRLGVTARVVNRMDQEAPMVILDLPIPAGFTVDAADFRQMVEEKKIDKFQVTPRQVIVYLRGLQPGQGLALTYGLRATMPVKVQVPAARAYEYYNPARQGQSVVGQLTVTAN